MFTHFISDSDDTAIAAVRAAVLVMGGLLWATSWSAAWVMSGTDSPMTIGLCLSAGPLVWIALALGIGGRWAWAARWLVVSWFCLMVLLARFSVLQPAGFLLNFVAIVAFAGWVVSLPAAMGVAIAAVLAALYFQQLGIMGVPAVFALAHCLALMLWVLRQVRRHAAGRIEEAQRHVTLLESQSQQLTLLSQAIEETPECVAIVDFEGTLVYVNRTFERQCGCNRGEAIGRRSVDISCTGLLEGNAHQKMREIVEQGRVWSSTLYNRRKDGQRVMESVSIAPVRDAAGQITHFIEIKRDLREQMETEQRIDRLQNRDEVTQLPNAAAMVRGIDGLLMHQQAMRSEPASGAKAWHGVALLHMDRFNDFRDARGAAAASALRQAVAAHLTEQLPANAWLANTQPDQFAVVMEHLGQSHSAALRHLHSAVLGLRSDAYPLVVDAASGTKALEQVQMNYSVGLMVFSLEDPLVRDAGAAHVLRCARVALKQAQRLGTGQVHAYSDDLVESARRTQRIETDLYAALRAPGPSPLHIYLQPQADWAGRIQSAEALIRWQHPELGWISPGEFIPVAEHAGLIVPVGDWVLKQVCRLLADPQVVAGGFGISANVSPLQLQQPDFVPKFEALLESSGIEPSRLTLEVTESALLDDVHSAIQKMEQLVALGVHLALDDFGTGYSSLSYLRELPIHEIKIDQSLIRDLDVAGVSGALVEAVLMVAHRKGLRVVAEGVESEAQADLLRALDPTVLCQGYWISQPIPVAQWLANPQLVGEVNAGSPSVVSPAC